ncbi:GNAT family N-acetyltransferase [Chitinibacter sp. FCG-7]|uniref:GNAT family N-acetyltransferase n=1 Tax=Chitinibacter mangrovi TaxID=3153927 RepID=A0AAU7F3X6_9NEIS
MNLAVNHQLIELRPINSDDMPVLLQIYAASRAAEMDLVPFSEPQKAEFLRMQFMAQHTHYQTYYPRADFCCIVQEETVLGRLYIDRHPDEIRIMDICLLPEYCYQRIGSYFMKQLLGEASRVRAKLTAHVEFGNPARAWYARLGFQEIEERGAYIFVAREPDLPISSLPSNTIGDQSPLTAANQTNHPMENTDG